MPQVANGNFKTKDSYLTKHESLKGITSFFKECIDDYCNTIINSEQRLVITQLWGNRNPKGSKHHEHVHPRRKAPLRPRSVQGVASWLLHQEWTGDIARAVLTMRITNYILMVFGIFAVQF